MVSSKRSDPGAEAWQAMWRLFLQHKPRLMAVAQEHELTPMQMHALRVLDPEAPIPMRTLAERLVCDPSNVTGIVDRLTARGLIERRDAPHDRRAKLLAITEAGERVRADVVRRLAQPPPGIADLPEADQRTLRDLVTQALETGGAEQPQPARPRPVTTTARQKRSNAAIPPRSSSAPSLWRSGSSSADCWIASSIVASASSSQRTSVVPSAGHSVSPSGPSQPHSGQSTPGVEKALLEQQHLDAPLVEHPQRLVEAGDRAHALLGSLERLALALLLERVEARSRRLQHLLGRAVLDVDRDAARERARTGSRAASTRSRRSPRAGRRARAAGTAAA